MLFIIVSPMHCFWFFSGLRIISKYVYDVIQNTIYRNGFFFLFIANAKQLFETSRYRRKAKHLQNIKEDLNCFSSNMNIISLCLAFLFIKYLWKCFVLFWSKIVSIYFWQTLRKANFPTPKSNSQPWTFSYYSKPWLLNLNPGP